MEDLKQISGKNGIITEGAAYLPKLMKRIQMPENRYISITPTEEFQVFHFRKREFVPYVLKGCSDMEKAFEKWMKRDTFFAHEVRRQCDEENFVSLINNGEMAINELVNIVSAHFELDT